MEEKEKNKIIEEILGKEETKRNSELDLRGMELMAYSSVLDAFRAEGTLDKEKRGIIESLKKHFNISEARHIAELRRVNACDKITKIAECLKSSKAEDDSWETEAYDTFPTLPSFQRRIGGIREPFRREITTLPITILPSSDSLLVINTSSRPSIEEDSLLAKFKWNNRVKNVSRKVQTKISTSKNKNIKVEVESESESSDEDVQTRRAHQRSPDIIDAASPPKNKGRGKVVTRTTRGPKRRLSMENSAKAATSSKSVTPSAKVTKKLNAKTVGKIKGQLPKIKFPIKKRPTTPSSEEELKDIKHEPHMTPVKPTNIKNTGPMTMRGHAVRARGSGLSRGRGRGGGRIITPQQTTFVRNDHNQVPPPTRAESLSPIKRSQISSPTKTMKTLKPKKPKPVSISRRKSRLKEKEDDEMQMEWNDDEDDSVIISNKQIPIKKRRLLSNDGSQTGMELEKGDSTVHQNNFKQEHVENGEAHKDIVVRHHQYLSPESYNRIDIPHRSPQLSGEETDSASEKGSTTGSRTNESPSNTSNASSPPPIRQKQRLKTPLAPIPQLPRVTIPPPVFSTSLSNVQKKRPQKHISVVDSLNLHLPTTATASSLASSARRPSLGTGNNTFSNSAMLIANARGGPGILNQRKAAPHILSNHKAIQRSFVPTTSNNPTTPTLCVSVGGVGGTTINLTSNPNPINSIVSNTGTILSTGVHQVQTSIIPTISSSTSSAVLQIPSSSATPLSMSGAIPIGAVAGARASGPGPIIFLQKANSSPNVSTSALSIASNTIPVKTPSRAVILRRTQLPRPGNVMILDMQNKPIQNQFLQPVSRILTAPSDVVLSIHGGQPQAKMIQVHSAEQSSEPTVVYSLSPHSSTITTGSQRKQKLGGNQIIHSVINPQGEMEQTEITHYQGQDDSQMAQIEAEMLEMEQEIVYEEEVVTTSEGQEIEGNNQFHNETIYAIPVSHGKSSNAAVLDGNFSTVHKIVENRHNSIEVSLTQQRDLKQMSNALTRAIVSSTTSPSKESVDCASFPGNAQNHISEFSNQSDDIFQTALKSSGIVFADQQFYDVDEMCASGDSQLSLHQLQAVAPVTLANHIIIENQENGRNIE